jgi:D-arabinose 1-dehydrogenase-like Zn-dependent alcohol dehydrogenase
MRALTVESGRANSARVEDVPEPRPDTGAVLVRTLALGICETDMEIVAGEYGGLQTASVGSPIANGCRG